MMCRAALTAVAFAVCLPIAAAAQAPPLTGGAFEHLIGDWVITGVTRGKPTQTGAEVRSVFGGAFLEMHITDPDKRSPYEARVFIGEDAQGGLIVHWLDGTGGDTSRTVGTGTIKGNHITLKFPYPGAEFRDHLDYDRVKDRWRLVIDMGPPNHVEEFCNWAFDRVSSP